MKYTLTSETKVNLFGVTLFRIKHSTTEQLGGWVQSEANLSQDGNAWVSGDAEVFGNAWVSGDAKVSGNAWVSGDAISKPSDCITVTNLQYNITATPKFIRIGCQFRSHSEWLATNEAMAVEMGLSKVDYPFFMAMIKLLVSHFGGDL